jgi:hypothetical protein
MRFDRSLMSVAERLTTNVKKLIISTPTVFSLNQPKGGYEEFCKYSTIYSALEL